MKETMKHIARAALFLGGLFLLMMLLAPVFRPKNNSPEAGMDFAQANGILGEPAETIDVVLVGDSEVYNAISPLEMWKRHGFTAYDCSTGGQQIHEAYEYIQQALEKQKPKVLILETNLLFRKLGFENYFKTRLEHAITLLRYHDRWKHLTAADLSLKTEQTWTDDLKGFRYHPETQGFEPEEYQVKTEEVKSFNRFSRFYLQKIRELCDANGVQLMFLTTPTVKNWNYGRHNGVEFYAEEYGLEYLDMNVLPEDTLAIDWQEDTKDMGDHLNYSGAKKATRCLGDYLAEQFDLPDHREDPAYAAWNKAYKKYKKLVKK